MLSRPSSGDHEDLAGVTEPEQPSRLALCCGAYDACYNGIEVGEDVLVRDTEDAPAEVLEVSVAGGVLGLSSVVG